MAIRSSDAQLMSFTEARRWVKILKRCGWIVPDPRFFPSSRADVPGSYGIVALDPKSAATSQRVRTFLSSDEIQSTLSLTG
jgi:hypothetical protein